MANTLAGAWALVLCGTVMLCARWHTVGHQLAGAATIGSLAYLATLALAPEVLP